MTPLVLGRTLRTSKSFHFCSAKVWDEADTSMAVPTAGSGGDTSATEQSGGEEEAAAVAEAEANASKMLLTRCVLVLYIAKILVRFRIRIQRTVTRSPRACPRIWVTVRGMRMLNLTPKIFAMSDALFLELQIFQVF